MARRCLYIVGQLSLWVCIFFVSACDAAKSMDGLHLDKIRLPVGFRIQIYAKDIPNARSMALSPTGILYVGSRKAGKVYAVVDSNRDYRADKVMVVDDNLNMPNGVAFYDNDLYVAEVHRIVRYENITQQLNAPPDPIVVSNRFPRDQHHGWKYIAFGPDGWLYVPVGAPCNVCVRTDPRYAAIMRLKPDGSRLEIFASGIRNSVGFDWHPLSKTLWFTNNGRDWMGDDRPPDTLHHAPQKGMHFGFPYCHGGDISDPKYGKKRPCSEFDPPEVLLGPHVAALGMKFYTGQMFPKAYAHSILIAEHGSWNRSVPIGYRISQVILEDGHPAVYQVFADGWLQGTRAWGRPVDILQLPDGSVLVSDDRAGVIYRIDYRE